MFNNLVSLRGDFGFTKSSHIESHCNEGHDSTDFDPEIHILSSEKKEIRSSNSDIQCKYRIVSYLRNQPSRNYPEQYPKNNSADS